MTPHDGSRHERTRLDDAREVVRTAAEPLERTETVALDAADGRVVAAPLEAPRPVPHYDRAAMDGYAVRAEDTFGAADRSPAVLSVASAHEGAGGASGAVPVDTGDPLPDGADAVVRREDTRRVGDDVEVTDGVAAGDNVGAVGEDVEAGQRLVEAGQRLTPPDVGLLSAVGHRQVEVVERPTVAIVPTGDEVVAADPEPGEVVGSNGPTVAAFVRRWGGVPTVSDPVGDDEASIRAAVEAASSADVVATIGGTSMGESDLVPTVVGDVGEVRIRGIATRPGHPTSFGVVDGTPVVMLPGYPVATVVAAVQLLATAVRTRGRASPQPMPSTTATLGRKVLSEPGVRSFARVRIEAGEEGPEAVPVRAAGASVLSSVTEADGWVVVPESKEGLAAGETVTVENWSYHP